MFNEMTTNCASIPQEMAPDRVQILLDQRKSLMAQIQGIDEQMRVISEMVKAWMEMAR